MKNIEETLHQIFQDVEELRVEVEKDKIRIEEADKFSNTLQRSLQDENKLPFVSPKIADEHFNVVMNCWKKQIDIIKRISPKLEKQLEDAIVQTERAWEKALKHYTNSYDEYTSGNRSKGEKMLSETSTEIGTYVIAQTALGSGVNVAYTCITDLADRVMD